MYVVIDFARFSEPDYSFGFVLNELFFIYILVCIVLGIYYARKREYQKHARWMTRKFVGVMATWISYRVTLFLTTIATKKPVLFKKRTKEMYYDLFSIPFGNYQLHLAGLVGYGAVAITVIASELYFRSCDQRDESKAVDETLTFEIN